MYVHKFGGASVKDAAGIRRVSTILKEQLQEADGPMLVVVSAMGKTTNALEQLAQLAAAGKEEACRLAYDELVHFHRFAAQELFAEEQDAAWQRLKPYFDALERVIQGVLLLEEFPRRIYDRIMSFGELLSTTLLHHNLQHEGWAQAAWADARTLVATDSRYTQANLVWERTRRNVEQHLLPLFNEHKLVVTQGYIGANSDGKTTTLGREGSDYSAAIFANLLAAKQMSVWKDVPGVMSADPKAMPSYAKVLPALDYTQAVQLTYYGAQVLHPKTLKPLQQAGIPLRVKCFTDSSLPGTKVSGNVSQPAHMCRIHKQPVAWLTARSPQLAFMDERLMRSLLNAAQYAGLEPRLIGRSALELGLCIDDKPEQVSALQSNLSDEFDIKLETGLELLTLLFADNPALPEGISHGRVLLHEQVPGRSHWLLKPV